METRILFNTLKNLRSDDILVYTDAGSSFSIFAKKDFLNIWKWSMIPNSEILE